MGLRTALALLAAAAAVDGLYVEREIQARWTFMGYFTFDTLDPDLWSKVYGPDVEPVVPWMHIYRTDKYMFDENADPDLNGYALQLYSDQDFSWPSARALVEDDDGWSENPIEACRALTDGCPLDDCNVCRQKLCNGPLGLAPQCAYSPNQNQSLAGKEGSCVGTKAKPYSQPIIQQSRPRIWYVAITNCLPTLSASTPKIKVAVHFQNPGGWFKKEFGVDEQGILEYQILLVPLFTVMTAVYCTFTYIYRKQQGDAAETHAVIKWFIMILVLQTVFFVDKLLAYVRIATYGAGFQNLHSLGTLADVMMMMLCVNFATGFSAIGTRFFSTLKDPFHRNVIAGMGIFMVVVNWLLFFWWWFYSDPMSTDHHYQTWPAIILASIRLPIAIYYVYSIHKRMTDLPDQAKYYKRWGIVFFFYVISYPFLMGAAYLVPPHVKFKSVDLSVDIVTCLAMLAMMRLLWPGAKLSMVLENTYTITEDVAHVPMTDGPGGADPLNASRRSLATSVANSSFVGGVGGGGTRSRAQSEIEMGLVQNDGDQSEAALLS